MNYLMQILLGAENYIELRWVMIIAILDGEKQRFLLPNIKCKNLDLPGFLRELLMIIRLHLNLFKIIVDDKVTYEKLVKNF